MSSISNLQYLLASSSHRELIVSDAPRELRQLVREMSNDVDRLDEAPSPDRRLAAIAAYMRNGVFSDPRQLRTLCFSIMDTVPSVGKRLLSFTEPFRRLLDAVLALPGMWFRKCYQGLLASYFGETNIGGSTEASERDNWGGLRDFLAAGIVRLQSLRRIPLWATTLASQPQLLTEKPCEAFGADIADGNMEPFNKLRTDLDIASASWLLQEAAAAAIRAGCARPDQCFPTCLHNLLELIERYPLIANQAMADILRRYATIPGAPESSKLLQKAIELWGNPLRRRNLPSWDRAGEAATQMCSMWLKTSLIEDFFEHLSADGSADRRRVDFWKRYVPYIDDMYFALGRNARNDRSQDTKRLRNTMGDRLLRLEGAPNNNAFLMQMGDFIVVEFGLAGNASFIFKHDNLPFSLDAEIRTDGRSLWQAYARDRLLHMDGNGAWEDVFAASILRNLSIPDPRRKNPASAKRSMDTASRVPALATEAPKPERIDKTAYSVVTDVQQLDNEVEFSPERLTDCCLLYGVKVKRHSRNVFEVWANNRNPGLTAILERWGFHYNPLRRTWSLVRDRL